MTILIRPSNPPACDASHGFQETQFWQLKAKKQSPNRIEDFQKRSAAIPKHYFERPWIFMFGPNQAKLQPKYSLWGAAQGAKIVQRIVLQKS